MRNLLTGSKFKKDILFGYVAQAVAMFMGFVNIYLITNYAGIERYGLYSVLVASIGFLSLLVTARSGEAIVKFYKREKIKNDYRGAKTILLYGVIIDLFTAFILFIITYLLSDVIAIHLLKDETLRHEVLIFSLINVFYFLGGTMRGYFQANELFYHFNGLNIFESIILTSLLAYTLLYQGVELLNIVSCYIAAKLLVLIILIILFLMHCMKELKNITFNISLHSILEYLKFNMITFSSSALKAGNQNFDGVILSYFTNPGTVGFYTVIKKLFIPTVAIAVPFKSIGYPKLAKHWFEENYHQFHNAIKRITRILFCLTLFYAVVMVVLQDLLVQLFNLGDVNGNETLIVFFSLYFILISLLWWTRSFSNIVNPVYSLVGGGINTAYQVSVSVFCTYMFGVEGLILSLIFLMFILSVYWVLNYKIAMVRKMKPL